MKTIRENIRKSARNLKYTFAMFVPLAFNTVGCCFKAKLHEAIPSKLVFILGVVAADLALFAIALAFIKPWRQQL